jgi:hypothetical protein
LKNSAKKGRRLSIANLVSKGDVGESENIKKEISLLDNEIDMIK